MTGEGNAQGAGYGSEEIQSPLVLYLDQQGEAVQGPHRLMERLELASLAVPLAVIVAAIVAIAAYGRQEVWAIPAALFCIPASFTPYFALLGLHAIIIRAFPPLEFLGGRLSAPGGFHTGRLAVWWGALIMLAALGAGALWATGAYAFLNPDILNVLIPSIIVVMVSFAIAAGWLLLKGR